MTYLITGGAGFIGSHLAEYLLMKGEQVIVIDDLSTGSVANLLHLKGNSKLECHYETIFDRHLLAELVDRSDVIYHLAAAVGVRLIIERPVHTIETNVTGTERVLHAAAKKGKPVFIASTSEVYGKNTHGTFQEDDDLVLGSTSKCRWGYAASKAVDEFLSLAYCKQNKLPVTIGRFFNTVGPRQTARYGMVLPTFINQAIANDPITIFGTGKQSRCFGYVGEVVEAIYRLMHSASAIGQVVNIGNDQEITIEELAILIKDRVGSNSQINYIPYDAAYESGFEDMFRRKPCLDRLEKLTGFRPRMKVAQIVDRVLESLPESKSVLAPAMMPHIHSSHSTPLAASAGSD